MRIDVHAHYWTEEYLDLLTDLGKADAGQARGIGAGGGADLEARLRLMDRAGVQMQVLSACPQWPYGEDTDQAACAARFVNDQYAELAKTHRDRFAAFAALPMPHLDESVAEMGRALDQLGMAGIALNTSVLGHALAGPGFEPVFAELNRRAAVLYLHPAGNSACSRLIGNYHLTWMVGAPVEDTISIMQLITRGVPAAIRTSRSSTPTSAERCRCCCSEPTTSTAGRHRTHPSGPAWPRAGCGTTPSGTGASPRCGARSTPSARTSSS
jgi:6-methylsalicylate decarboxylase